MEIITRGERRRRWSAEQKREIVAESYGPDLTPTEVARKHGISSGQLYTWRREVLGLQAPVVSRATPRFAEVEVTAPLPSAASASAPAALPGPARTGGRIEVFLPGDVIVRVDAEVDGAALRRVLEALRRR
ncbi:MAG TPA: transposase [Acetobacteraceae bacterium]|nr:transposase [Acetobacteraceae bacterium]